MTRAWVPARRARCVVTGVLCALAPVVAGAQGAMPGSVRPGDVLRIRVFREPEYSGEFAVSERGVVTLPRLGDVRVTEWPADSIRPRLTRSFATFLREAVVDLVILRRVAISGAVLKPGLYTVDPTMRLDDILALAGGPSSDGRRDEVELIRGDTHTRIQLRGAREEMPLHVNSGDRIRVPQRGWISRNTWLVGSLIGAAATVLAVTAR